MARDVAMLARTHGQSASPTRVGKEFAVFASRLQACVDQLTQCSHIGEVRRRDGRLQRPFRGLSERRLASSLATPS